MSLTWEMCEQKICVVMSGTAKNIREKSWFVSANNTPKYLEIGLEPNWDKK